MIAPNMLAAGARPAAAPAFFSAVTKAVEASPLTKGTAEQWAGTLRNTPGVKVEELEWLGLDDFLKQPSKEAAEGDELVRRLNAGESDPRKPRGTITKQEILDFVRDNQVEVQEVAKGGKAPMAAEDIDFAALDREAFKTLEDARPRGAWRLPTASTHHRKPNSPSGNSPAARTIGSCC
jgi:hypothetical protein